MRGRSQRQASDGAHYFIEVLRQDNVFEVDKPTFFESFRNARQKIIGALVADLGMPEVDGYQLIRRVRALGRSGKIAGADLGYRAEPTIRSMRNQLAQMEHLRDLDSTCTVSIGYYSS